jgi:hypothetical protein
MTWAAARQRSVPRPECVVRDVTTPSPSTQIKMSLPEPRGGEVTSVMWREGSWRCDFYNLPERPVFRLYEGETLELEQCVSGENFTAIAEMLREAVRRLLSADGSRSAE